MQVSEWRKLRCFVRTLKLQNDLFISEKNQQDVKNKGRQASRNSKHGMRYNRRMRWHMMSQLYEDIAHEMMTLIRHLSINQFYWRKGKKNTDIVTKINTNYTTVKQI